MVNIASSQKIIMLNFHKIVLLHLALGKENREIKVCPVKSNIQFLDD